MEQKYHIDLHMHTIASDGTTTPKAVIDAAAAHGLKKIVLADHNNLHDNYERLREYAATKGVELPFEGVEVTAFYRKNGKPFIRFHFLVYGRSEAIHFPAFEELLSQFNKVPNQYILKDLQEINRSGEVSFTEEELFVLDPDIAPTKKEMKYATGYLLYAVAKALHITYEEAMVKFPPSIQKELGHRNYESLTAPIDVEEVLKIAKERGLVTVLAHPQWIDPFYPEDKEAINDEALLAMLRDLCKMGLNGVEVTHQINDEEHQALLRRFAEENGLICTGGSDFHGNMEGYGCHLGQFGVTEETFCVLEGMVK